MRGSFNDCPIVGKPKGPGQVGWSSPHPTNRTLTICRFGETTLASVIRTGLDQRGYRMRLLILPAAILVLSLGLASAQQVNDPDADVSVAHPAFPQKDGPVVAIDSGHSNFHTIDGRYQPFASVLRNDGFRVVDSKSPFTADSLSGFKVLVISNALPAALVKDWSL